MSAAWWQVLVGIVSGLVGLWLVLLLVLWRAKPDAPGLREALRLLPDVLRLVARLARDGSLPRSVHVRLSSSGRCGRWCGGQVLRRCTRTGREVTWYGCSRPRASG